MDQSRRKSAFSTKPSTKIVAAHAYESQPLWDRVRIGRIRILWLVLGAMLLVSALPIALYHRQVFAFSQGKLADTERVQQTDLTRAFSQEINSFSNLISPSNCSASGRFWRSQD